MTKQEIFDLEQANSDKIHLFLEGSFWIAYEKSAFRFVRSVRAYKVKKKLVKNVGQQIASLGFPAAAFDAIASEAALEIVERSAGRIILRAPEPLTEEDFNRWKAGLEIFVPQSRQPEYKPKETAYEVMTSSAEASDLSALMAIVYRIRNFSVENKTPMECLFFVSELRNQVNHLDARKEAQA